MSLLSLYVEDVVAPDNLAGPIRPVWHDEVKLRGNAGRGAAAVLANDFDTRNIDRRFGSSLPY